MIFSSAEDIYHAKKKKKKSVAENIVVSFKAVVRRGYIDSVWKRK